MTDSDLHRSRFAGRVPLRVVVILGIVGVVILVSNASSIRAGWAHRLADLTGGSLPVDYLLGLVVALLPVAGVALGTLGRRGPRRLLRMALFGAAGFIATFLLAPSPLRYLTNTGTTRATFSDVPGYLPGVFSGVIVWVVTAVGGYLLLRTRWRRFVARVTGGDPRRGAVPGPPDPPRVIDV
jgi:hypothetical protein